jgi:hypothetical protein
MKSKFCYVCSAVLLCANTFGTKRPRNDYAYNQKHTNFQEVSRKKNYGEYDYYRSNYVRYGEEQRSTYRRNDYDTPNLRRREIKNRKMLDKEREGAGDLFDNYKYQEALDFFEDVCENERCYPTLIWNYDEVNKNESPKIDFGKFDQRKKFIDMFENCDENSVSNFININFNYGGQQHNMHIKQSERWHGEYDTDNFLFEINTNFAGKQASCIPSGVKPYLSKRNKDGILENFIKHPEGIQKFAINVLRLMKLSPQKDILPIDREITEQDETVTFKSFEIAGMILSTERLRSKKSLLLSYIEFYKLKHTTDCEKSSSMLFDMFDKDRPTLRFPTSPGGVEDIQTTHPYYIYKRFLDMLQYSPKYSTIRQCEDKNVRQKLMDEFFYGKLEKIRAVLENRHPAFKSEFKSAVQDYLQNAMEENTSKSSTQ